MEEVENELYKIHGNYVNASYSLDCLLNMLDKLEMFSENSDDYEFRESIHVVKLVVENLCEKMHSNNVRFDMMMLNFDKKGDG